MSMARSKTVERRLTKWSEPPSRWRIDHLLVLVPLLFLTTLFLYPLANALISSFGGETPFSYYSEIFSDGTFQRAAVRTLWVSLLATLITLMIAYPLAYEITRPRNSFRVFLLVLVLVTFWVSVLIRAYAWVAILRPGGVLLGWLDDLGLDVASLELTGSPFGVTVGTVHFLLPYMVLVLIPSLTNVRSDYLAAARSLGASRTRAFLRVTLPLSKAGIFAGVLLTFILAVGFLVMPAILGGPTIPFVANLIGQQVGLFQNFEVAAAMGVLLTLLVVLLYLMLLRFVDPTRVLGGGHR